MIYTIAGAVIITVAIWGGFFTLKNGNNMPFSVFGLNKENYEVIDKRKFNKVMVIQSLLVCICFLLIGLLLVIFREPEVFTIAPLYIFINMLFSKVAKKCIKIK